jgi:hypothetical protein
MNTLPLAQPHFPRILAVAVAAALIAETLTAAPAVSAQLDPPEISLGEAAVLSVTTSGQSARDVSLPKVAGLDIIPVGQSQQIQIINGVTTATRTLNYQVIPQRAGTFTIPPLDPADKQLVLHVRRGNGSSSAARGNASSGGANLPPPITGGLSAGATRLDQDGAAFVRLRLPKRELRVGELVPVEIQVGLRAGLAGQLSGLPTLNGDAFTLNKLPKQPEQAQEVVNGQPYTVLTWRSALAAVKAGEFSLSVQTPVTVQVRTQMARPRMRGMFGDLFDDPFFQNFFGGVTEKQITLASEPDAIKVLELPTEGRPSDFNGAVGEFDVTAELTTTNATVGDPLTLRLKVTGTGNFDRVNSAMLGEVGGWKTYKPAAKFEAADSASLTGEKVFEQAIIPSQAGSLALPAMSFSYYNPDAGRYETKRTSPLTITVAPAPAGGLAATVPPANAPANASARPASGQVSADGLRPDHAIRGRTVASLRPLYFQPWFLATQSALLLGFAALGLILRRREARAHDPSAERAKAARKAVEACLAEMEAAANAQDAARFFASARSALQHRLATRWGLVPEAITIAEVDARMNGDGAEIRRLFALADQAAYSGQHLAAGDFQQWKTTVLNQLNP